MTTRRSAILVLVLLVLSTGTVQAADLGARAMGMGGAYVALADDATAVYWNPAGLTNVSWVSLTPVAAVETTGANSLKSFIKIIDPDTSPDNLPAEDFSLTASGNGLAGVVAKRFGVTYLPSATVNVTYDHSVPSITGSSTVYNDTAVSVAFPLAKTSDNKPKTSVGANVKFVQGKYYEPPTGPLAGGVAMDLKGTANGYALDLGLQGQLSERLRYGVVARNLVRNVTWSGEGPDETNRPTLQAGLAFKAPLGFTVAADVENTRENGQDLTRLRAGFEESLFGILALRAGVRTGEDNPTYTVGLGAGLFKFLRLEFAAASDLKDRAEGSLTLVAQF